MSAGRMKVLLVAESERDVRRLQSVSAARGGGHFELTHVRSLADAMRELAGDRFDAVLLDLAERSDPVARVDALEPLVKLREGAPDVPIIVLTGVDDETIGVRALKAGAQDSLVKGMLDGHLLFRAIRYAIERHQLQMALRAMSLVDDLTGLYNRRGFLTLARQQLKIADRMRKRVSHIFVDLDGLKAINDRYGHLVGSRALCRIAEVLRRSCRAVDTAARFGGDEFAVALPETDEIAAQHLAERIAAGVVGLEETPRLSVSIGVAIYPRDGASIEELFTSADRRMYADKSRHARPVVR